MNQVPPREINILVGPGIMPTDRESFFGPLLPTDVFHEYPAEVTFPEVLMDHGFFMSRGDARRNGWIRPVPDGWTDLFIGKLKRRLSILKITGHTP